MKSLTLKWKTKTVKQTTNQNIIKEHHPYHVCQSSIKNFISHNLHFLPRVSFIKIIIPRCGGRFVLFTFWEKTIIYRLATKRITILRTRPALVIKNRPLSKTRSKKMIKDSLSRLTFFISLISRTTFFGQSLQVRESNFSDKFFQIQSLPDKGR